MDRTLAVQFKTWHINTCLLLWRGHRYAASNTAQVSKPKLSVLSFCINAYSIQQHNSHNYEMCFPIPSCTHGWVDLCSFISLHAVIDVLLLPIFMWLSRLECSDEGSDWMKSVLHCVLWDYPAPGQTQIRPFFSYLPFSVPLYHLHLLTPSLPVGE